MDTRNKIIPLQKVAALLADGQWLVAVGRFDPLTVAEAARLAELGKDLKLLAVVLQGDALLEISARAALVAALRVVSAVAIASPEEWRAAIKEGPRVNVVQDPAGDAARRNAFVEMVLSKQQQR